MDLVAFIAGETWDSPELILELLDRLPEGSELMAERLGNRQLRDWGLSQYLMLNISNALNLSNYLYVMAHSKKGAQIPPYEPQMPPEANLPAVEEKPHVTLDDLFSRFA